MFSVIIALLVTVVVGYFVVKKYKPQAVLLAGGIFLMIIAAVFGMGEILPTDGGTGFWFFDIFEYIKTVFAADAAGTGMIIMAVGGFAIYMDYIGASTAMVNICIKPLQKLNAPYVVLSVSYLLGQFLNVFIPSAAGLSVLLMATLFPVLVELGVSRLSAAALIGTAACLDLGPASGASNMAAQIAGLEPMVYFVKYQLPVAAVVVVVIAVLHYVVQKYCDKKENFQVSCNEKKTKHSAGDVPRIYAILPLIPMILLFVFSELVINSIKMNVITAMFIGVAVAIVFELFTKKGDMKNVLKSIQVFFDGMGSQFASVVTLIIAGEIFAKGLQAIGAIDVIIEGCKATGFGPIPMTIVMVLIITICSIVMGSGNAPFYAFVALAPTVAEAFGIPVVLMAMPMQLGSGIARSISPITSVIVAVSDSADLFPIDVVKRTAIPMVGGLIAMLMANFIIFL